MHGQTMNERTMPLDPIFPELAQMDLEPALALLASKPDAADAFDLDRGSCVEVIGEGQVYCMTPLFEAWSLDDGGAEFAERFYRSMNLCLDQKPWIFHLLAKMGMIPRRLDDHGNSALHHLAANGCVGALAETLRKLGPRLARRELSRANCDGRTPAESAMAYGKLDAIRAMDDASDSFPVNRERAAKARWWGECSWPAKEHEICKSLITIELEILEGLAARAAKKDADAGHLGSPASKKSLRL